KNSGFPPVRTVGLHRRRMVAVLLGCVLEGLEACLAAWRGDTEVRRGLVLGVNLSAGRRERLATCRLNSRSGLRCVGLPLTPEVLDPLHQLAGTCDVLRLLDSAADVLRDLPSSYRRADDPCELGDCVRRLRGSGPRSDSEGDE